MKRLREASTNERLNRAMLMIECVCSASCDDFIAHRGKPFPGFSAEEYIAMLQEQMSHCYRMAHAAIGRCCAGGSGEPWLDLIEDLEEQLAKEKIVNAEKFWFGHFDEQVTTTV
jgi:hypothetical protein